MFPIYTSSQSDIKPAGRQVRRTSEKNFKFFSEVLAHIIVGNIKVATISTGAPAPAKSAQCDECWRMNAGKIKCHTVLLDL